LQIISKSEVTIGLCATSW